MSMLLQVELRCNCGQLVVKSYPDGNTKIRSKILVLDRFGKAVAVCKTCGKEHAVPLKLQKSPGYSKSIKHFIVEKVLDK